MRAETGDADLRREARAVRHDNDDGGVGYFEPDRARWTVERIPIKCFMHLMGRDEWARWLEDEIAHADSERPALYRALVAEAIQQPIVASLVDGKAWIWDGFHRVGASVTKGAPDIEGIVGRPIVDARRDKDGRRSQPDHEVPGRDKTNRGSQTE